MGFRIQNNIAAMNAQRNLNISDTAMSKSLERLSSGYRINSAKDDAAGLAISQQFRADIASYKVASRNVSEANSLVQVAEGGMDQIGNMLTRLKELATQAASANAGSNLDKINAEGNKLIEEIDRIAGSTKYAGTNLLNGSFGVTLSSGGTWTASTGMQAASGMASGQTYNVAVVSTGAAQVSMTVSATLAGGQRYSETVYGITDPSTGTTKDVSFASLGLTITVNDSLAADTGTIIANAATASNFQVGTTSDGNDQIGVLIGSVKSSDMNSGLVSDQLDDATEAQAFLDTVNSAISYLSSERGKLGAVQNRLGYASANLATTVENYSAADSVIRDVDMASEMTSFTKNQILLQAGTAMLSQANQAPQMVLSLFQ
jgi:flagellin